MISLLQEIEHTYIKRCDDHSEFKDLWRKVVSTLPPNIMRCVDTSRPSLFLTQEAGDLGLAIMWIVQTALFRPILRDIGIQEIISSIAPITINESTIGALAHSEDRNYPAIIHSRRGQNALSGKKKYITGGSCADFILVTARKEGEDVTSSLIILPTETIPIESFREISLPMLRTIDHSSLEFHNLRILQQNLIPIEPAHLRRLLKRWSIVERGLIAEAYTGLCAYIAAKLEMLNLIPHSFQIEITSLLNRIQKNVTEMLNAALSSQIIPEVLPFNEIIMSYIKLKDSIPPTKSLPPEIALRFSDLALFEKINH